MSFNVIKAGNSFKLNYIGGKGRPININKIPNKTSLQSLDSVYLGQPFCNTVSRFQDTRGLENIYLGQPFHGITDNYSIQNIKVTSYHPDVENWLNNVSLNGGSVNSLTISALNTFCYSIDSAQLRNKFYRLNLFCGNNLNSALVPLYINTNLTAPVYGFSFDSNFGFFNSDYSENSGLQGNGSKYLLTGLIGTLLSAGNRHLSAYEIINATTDYSPSLGSADNNAIQHALGPWTGPNNYYYRTHNSVGGNPNTPTKSIGFWLGSDINTTSARLYKNGSTINTSNGQSVGGSSANQYAIFGTINNTKALSEGSEAKLGSYSIGTSLNDSQVLAYYNAIQAFQTSLVRNI